MSFVYSQNLLLPKKLLGAQILVNSFFELNCVNYVELECIISCFVARQIKMLRYLIFKKIYCLRNGFADDIS